MAFGVVLVILLTIIGLAFTVPYWYAAHIPGATIADRLKAEADLHSAILSLLAPLAALVVGAAALLTFGETRHQNREQLKLQQRGQTTDRFTKAIDQLGQPGPDKLDVRVGSIYALEQIAHDSPELQAPIVEVLSAFLRQHTLRREPPSAVLLQDVLQARLQMINRRLFRELGRRPSMDETAEEFGLSANSLVDLASRLHTLSTNDDGDLEFDFGEPGPRLVPQIDLQAAATVLARRQSANDGHAFLDLSAVDLRGVTLGPQACLDNASLSGAYLELADLELAHLVRASLSGAHLEGAYLSSANLTGASLRGTTLTLADLNYADLVDADFTDADLRFASLGFAKMSGAILINADLRRTDLSLTSGLARGQLRFSVTDASTVLPSHLKETSHVPQSM